MPLSYYLLCLIRAVLVATSLMKAFYINNTSNWEKLHRREKNFRVFKGLELAPWWRFAWWLVQL